MLYFILIYIIMFYYLIIYSLTDMAAAAKSFWHRAVISIWKLKSKQTRVWNVCHDVACSHIVLHFLCYTNN